MTTRGIINGNCRSIRIGVFRLSDSIVKIQINLLL